MSDNRKCKIEFKVERRCDVYPAFSLDDSVIKTPEELAEVLEQSDGTVVIMSPETLFAWMEKFREDDESPA
jgi:hypothetical protein